MGPGKALRAAKDQGALNFSEGTPKAGEGGSGLGEAFILERVEAAVDEEAFLCFSCRFEGVGLSATDLKVSIQFPSGADGEGFGEEFAIDGARGTDCDFTCAEKVTDGFTIDLKGLRTHRVVERDLGILGDYELTAGEWGVEF